jgi:hypothetical protein
MRECSSCETNRMLLFCVLFFNCAPNSPNLLAPTRITPGAPAVLIMVPSCHRQEFVKGRSPRGNAMRQTFSSNAITASRPSSRGAGLEATKLVPVGTCLVPCVFPAMRTFTPSVAKTRRELVAVGSVRMLLQATRVSLRKQPPQAPRPLARTQSHPAQKRP